MKNTLLFALLGAVYLAVEGHFFTYDDDSDNSYEYGFSPSKIVSRSPPGKHGYGIAGRSSHLFPSYYISKTLPHYPESPHGTGAAFDYPKYPRRSFRPHGRSDFADLDDYSDDYNYNDYYAVDEEMIERERALAEYRQYGPYGRVGRSKGKKGGQGWPIKGGWWYKIVKGKLISGRWGAPPPPGLEKEHYIYGGGYGGGHGGWGQQGWGGWQPPKHQGWGWPSYGGGGGGGYGGGYGGGQGWGWD